MSALIQIGVVAVALVGAVMVFIHGRQAFRAFDMLGPPTLVAILASALAFIGLLSFGPVLLWLAGALAIACLALPLLSSASIQRLRLPRRQNQPEVTRPERLQPWTTAAPIEMPPVRSDPPPAHRSKHDKERIIPLEIMYPGGKGAPKEAQTGKRGFSKRS
jgi:hypothetical protein